MAPWIAAPLISPFLSLLLNKVDKLLSEEYGLRRDEKEAIRSLQKTIKLIQATVDGADGQEVALNTQEWLKQLKELLYSAYDVLEEHETAVTRSRGQAELRVTRLQRLGRQLMFWKKRLFNNGMIVREIEKVNKYYEYLGKNKSTLGIQLPESRITAAGPFTSTKKSFPASLKRQTYSALASSCVLGRDDDKAKVLSWLKNDSTTENNVHTRTDEIYAESTAAEARLSIFPITGMGGMGKTTLAKLIYNDPQVKEWFDPLLMMWVHVSEDFQANKVISDMLMLDLDPSSNGISLQGLQSKLTDHIRGKRFFLVLDDVWPNVAQKDWEDLLAPLKHGEKGSKVLVTSRIDNIVDGLRKLDGIRDILSLRQPLHLKCLPDDCIREIFNMAAFGNRQGPTTRYHNEDEDDEEIDDVQIKEFETIRDELIKNRLKGSPLAAITLGRALGRNMDVQHWENIQLSGIWETKDQNGSDIMPVLYLSYLHLPPELKQCFSYCSIFPKGYVFTAFEMGMLWVSCGFIQPLWSDIDHGRSPINSLLDMSLIEHDKSRKRSPSEYLTARRITGNGIGGYVMHDLLIDMAEYATEGDSIKLIGGIDHQDTNSISVENTQHLSAFGKTFDANKLERYLSQCKKLRTLFLKGSSFQAREEIPEPVRRNLCKSRHLRVLVLENCDLLELPPSICKLVHLRYLSLYGSIIRKKIPKSIGRLYNLQFLNLQLNKYRIVPGLLSKLVNLRYLTMSPEEFNRIGPIDNMTSLQVLATWFNVKDKQKDVGHNIEELGKLNMLRELQIHALENVKNEEEARRANLDKKSHLGTLTLRWNQSQDASRENQVLQHLCPPECLENLIIYGHAGTECPAWLPDKVPKLKNLIIFYCSNWNFLQPLGQLSHLKVLTINKSNIKDLSSLFTTNGINFPAMKKLELLNMCECEGVRDARPFICLPNLQELELDCSKLEALSLEIPEVAQVSWDRINPLPWKCEHDNKDILLCSYTSHLYNSWLEKVPGSDSHPNCFPKSRWDHHQKELYCINREEWESIDDAGCFRLPKLKKLILREIFMFALDLPNNEQGDRMDSEVTGSEDDGTNEDENVNDFCWRNVCVIM